MGYATRGGFGLPNRELLLALCCTYGKRAFTYNDAQRSIPGFNRRSFMKLVHDGFIATKSATSPKKWGTTKSAIDFAQNRHETSPGAASA